MSVRAWLGGVLASIGILTIGWQAGASALEATATTATADTGTSSGSTGSSSGSSTDSSSSGSSTDSTTTDTTSSSGSGVTDGTYTGSAYSTRWGDVQVEVTISGGAITDVTALQLTDHDPRSVSISNYAAPVLRSEVLSAQTANVSMVGGATYTSQAYLQSLQSALDQAGWS